jgi:hypothetical protein
LVNWSGLLDGAVLWAWMLVATMSELPTAFWAAWSVSEM